MGGGRKSGGVSERFTSSSTDRLLRHNLTFPSTKPPKSAINNRPTSAAITAAAHLSEKPCPPQPFTPPHCKSPTTKTKSFPRGRGGGGVDALPPCRGVFIHKSWKSRLLRRLTRRAVSALTFSQQPPDKYHNNSRSPGRRRASQEAEEPG